MKAESPKRGVLLGNWGHYGEVLREIEADSGGIRMVGSATSGAEAADLLREARPDFAIVSAPPGRIAELATLAVNAGCHVICEKPLAVDLDSLDSLRAAVERAGVLVCPMLPTRARPACSGFKPAKSLKVRFTDSASASTITG